jgi:hypothetical protein
MTIESLDLAALRIAVRRAWSILAGQPARLSGFTLLVFVLTYLLAFVPGVGFLLKLAFGALFFAQMLALFGQAARGEEPTLARLVHALSLPMSSQFMLVLVEWGGFAIGLLYLWLAGGPDAVRALIAPGATPAEVQPVSDALLFRFEIVLYGVGTVSTFLAPVLVLVGARGLPAIHLALRAAWRNRTFVGLLAAWNIALEAVLAQIALLGGGAAPIYIALLLAALVFELALLYAVAERVFGAAPGPVTRDAR